MSSEKWYTETLYFSFDHAHQRREKRRNKKTKKSVKSRQLSSVSEEGEDRRYVRYLINYDFGRGCGFRTLSLEEQEGRLLENLSQKRGKRWNEEKVRRF